MSYWEDGSAHTLMALFALLLLGLGLSAAVRRATSVAIPVSILAGLLGLAVGPGAFGVIPMNVELLESLVYHGLAIVFIGVALQSPPEGKRSAGVFSFAVGIPWIIAMQMCLGLIVALLLGPSLHPGFGLMLALGFEQGPGQALSLGAAWAESGFTDGGQLGLIYAAIGFAWSIGIGVPLVVWGRKRGLLVSTDGHASGSEQTPPESVQGTNQGSLEPLTAQLAVIAVVYLATYGFVGFLAHVVFASMPGLSAMAWGFHFIFGAVIAMWARPLIQRVAAGVLDDALLGRVASMVVDVITCAALCAVQLAVLKAHAVPIIAITTAGGIATLVATVWLARRAFPEAPFEHCVVWFGLSTGTLPMGLALLRMVDPDLKTPASMSAVLGSGGALLGGAPLMMGIIPMVIGAWPAAYPRQGLVAVGILAAYMAVLLVVWAWFGSLRWRLQPRRMWPAVRSVEH